MVESTGAGTSERPGKNACRRGGGGYRQACQRPAGIVSGRGRQSAAEANLSVRALPLAAGRRFAARARLGDRPYLRNLFCCYLDQIPTLPLPYPTFAPTSLEDPKNLPFLARARACARVRDWVLLLTPPVPTMGCLFVSV